MLVLIKCLVVLEAIKGCHPGLVVFGEKCLGKVEEVPHVLGDIPFQIGTFPPRVVEDPRIGKCMDASSRGEDGFQLPMHYIYVV